MCFIKTDMDVDVPTPVFYGHAKERRWTLRVLRRLAVGSDSNYEIMSSDAAVMSGIERLTMSYIIQMKEILWSG